MKLISQGALTLLSGIGVCDPEPNLRKSTMKNQINQKIGSKLLEARSTDNEREREQPCPVLSCFFFRSLEAVGVCFLLNQVKKYLLTPHTVDKLLIESEHTHTHSSSSRVKEMEE
jgi:hypothetical protein